MPCLAKTERISERRKAAIATVNRNWLPTRLVKEDGEVGC